MLLSRDILTEGCLKRYASLMSLKDKAVGFTMIYGMSNHRKAGSRVEILGILCMYEFMSVRVPVCVF